MSTFIPSQEMLDNTPNALHREVWFSLSKGQRDVLLKLKPEPQACDSTHMPGFFDLQGKGLIVASGKAVHLTELGRDVVAAGAGG